MVVRQAKDLEVRDSNPGPGLSCSLEFKFFKALTIGLYLLVNLKKKAPVRVLNIFQV